MGRCYGCAQKIREEFEDVNWDYHEYIRRKKLKEEQSKNEDNSIRN